jgi:hypothetical protein
MNKEILIDVGAQLGRLRMYPLFDICHYLLIALQVREDIQQYQTGRRIVSQWFLSFFLRLNVIDLVRM